MKRLFVLLCLCPVVLIIAQHLNAGDKSLPLTLIKTIPLGGEGKWDYLLVDAEGQLGHIRIISRD